MLSDLRCRGTCRGDGANMYLLTLPPSPDLSLEEKIRLALQYFGGK